MTFWLLYIALVIVHLAGLTLNLIGLPGLWLMVAAHAGFAIATGGETAGWPSSLVMLGLALLAEGVEFAAGAAGSKTAGGSFRSTVGAIIGGIAGGVIGVILVPVVPVINAVLGACIGSFIGAALLEASKTSEALEDRGAFWGRLNRVGWGAFKGRLWGTVLKSAVGVAMLIVSLWTVF